MADSQFDPAAFLDSTTDTPNERRNPVPVENPDSPDGLYVAQVGEVTMACGIIGKGDKTGNPWLQAVVPLELQLSPALQAALGYEKPTFTVTDRPMLDLMPGATIDGAGKLSGSLDNGKGKNQAQRAYREATGMNAAGEKFSWRQVSGKLVKVKIKHEMYNGAPTEKVGGIFKNS